MRGIRTSYVVAGAVGFLGGVAATSLGFSFGSVLPWAFVVAGSSIAIIGALESRLRHRALIVVAVVAFALGVVRFTVLAIVARQATPVPDRTAIVVSGYAERVAMRSGRAVVVLKNSVGQDASERRSDRAAVVTFNRPIELVIPATADVVRYGDLVEANCSFRVPERLGAMLATSGTCIAYTTAHVRVVAQGYGSPTVRSLLDFRDRLTAAVNRALAEPTASIINGVLLGVDHGLPYDLTEAFRRSGTIHVLVVSGWHMSFIGIMLRNWLLRRGWIPRELALLLALGGVLAFAVMTGLAPSAVRGAAMVGMLIFVDLFGRIVSPVRILLLAAVAMVAIQPHILGYDLGFQLSFAATAGLFILEPIIRRWCTIAPLARAWRRWHTIHPRGAFLRSWGEEAFMLFTASTAASLATAPILVGSFGSLALLAPLTNIPVLLLIPALMYVGIALLTATFAFPALIPILAAIIHAFSDALVAIVTFAARIPWSAVATVRLDGWFIAGFYACAGVMIFAWYRHRGIALLSPFPWDRATLQSPSLLVPENSRPRNIGYREN